LHCYYWLIVDWLIVDWLGVDWLIVDWLIVNWLSVSLRHSAQIYLPSNGQHGDFDSLLPCGSRQFK
jgi:hypothetical protein